MKIMNEEEMLLEWLNDKRSELKITCTNCQITDILIYFKKDSWKNTRSYHCPRCNKKILEVRLNKT